MRLLFGGGKPPAAALGLVNGRRFGFRPGVRIVFGIPSGVPVQQVLVGTQQEGTGTTGGVEDLETGGLLGSLAFEKFPDGILDDVIDDIGGGVVDAASLADFGLFLDLGLVTGGKPDDFSQETLIDLPEDVGGDFLENIWAGIIQPGNDLFQYPVVDLQAQSQIIRAAGLSFFFGEMEETGVIAAVGLAEEPAQAFINLLRRFP